MSQLAVYIHSSGPGSGTVTSVSGGVGINITGVPTVNPTVNLDVPVTIAHGGTNAVSFTTTDGVVYFDGTSLVTTAVGTAGDVLTSNGAGMAPTFQSAGGGSITINGDSGSITGSTLTFTGGSSGAVFTGSMTTMTESFNFLALPDTNAGGTIGYISFGGNKYIHDFGTFNTFIGQGSGNFTLSGAAGNVGLGYVTLASLTTGGFNVALGIGALNSIDSGNNNVAIGATAMQSGDDASNSVAIGYQALNVLDAADNNVAIGSGAMVANIDSPANIAIGFAAINTMTTGNGLNIGIGNSVLTLLDSGQSNIAIGNNAGDNYNTTESSNIVIGNEGVNADNNTIRIGTQGTGVGQQDACFIAGIVGVTTSNSQMVTIDSTTGELGVATVPSASFTWSVITANQSALVNNGYIANKSGLLILTLPVTAAAGTLISITGINTALGWQIAQNSGQTIYFGNSSTTTGTGGSLASTLTRDTIELVCVVADNDWNVIGSIGNITIV